MRKLLFTLVIGLLYAPLWAHEEGFERAIEYRTGVMEVFAWNMHQMGQMIKGKQNHDPARFSAWARDLNAASQLDLLAGFPEDSDAGDDTDARAEIWLDWENFVAKLDALRKATDKLAKISNSADMNELKTGFQAVGKACKSCHKAFRE